MSNPDEYDLVILGSGEAGKYLAWTLASQGKRVAVVERRYVGGSCPNIACLPSKNVIHSAKVASYLRRGAEFGLAGARRPGRHGRRPRPQAEDGGRPDRDRTSASTGRAGPNSSWGAAPSSPRRRSRSPSTAAEPGPCGARTSSSAPAPARGSTTRPASRRPARSPTSRPSNWTTSPRTSSSSGGGYVGLELAQAFRRLGSRVTVVERNGALIHREDPDVTAAVGDLFRDEGIEVLDGTTLTRVEGTSGETVRLHGTRGGPTS